LERDRILADMGAHYDRRIVAYFAFPFYSGMRPEESSRCCGETSMGKRRRARSACAHLRGGESDRAKTYAERDVDLVPRAITALEAMKPYAFMKRDEQGRESDIFENPVTGSRWHDERSVITIGTRR